MGEICTRDELPQLIEKLDREFIFGKGRQLSLAERFADIFADPRTEILVARTQSVISAAVTLKPFRFLSGNVPITGAAIGLVWTDPADRGQGLAGQLIEDSIGQARSLGAAFMTLWTTRHGLYARHGFRGSDIGRFAASSFAVLPDTNANVRISRRADIGDILLRIEAIRAIDQPTRAERPADAWRRLPPPVHRLTCHVAETDSGLVAYALSGQSHEGVYLFEMVGDPDCYASLWNDLAQPSQRIFINDRQGSRSFAWFEQNLPELDWKAQNQSMWLPLIGRHNIAADWHIAYFDRL